MGPGRGASVAPVAITLLLILSRSAHDFYGAQGFDAVTTATRFNKKSIKTGMMGAL